MTTPTTAIATLLVLLAGTFAGACGGEDETATTTPAPATTAETGSTGATGPTGAAGDEAGDGAVDTPADLGDASAALEDAGFDLRPQDREDLTKMIPFDKEIQAEEGIYAAEQGGSSELGVDLFSTPQDAAAIVEEYENDFLYGEIVEETIVVSGTEGSRDVVADAVAAIEAAGR